MPWAAPVHTHRGTAGRLRCGTAGPAVGTGRGSRDPRWHRAGAAGTWHGGCGQHHGHHLQAGLWGRGMGSCWHGGRCRRGCWTTRLPEEGNTPKPQPVFLRKLSSFIQRDESTPNQRLHLHGTISTHDRPTRTRQLNGVPADVTDTTRRRTTVPKGSQRVSYGFPASPNPSLPDCAARPPGSRSPSGQLPRHRENHNTAS